MLDQIDHPCYGPQDDYYALKYIQFSTSCISHPGTATYTHTPASVRTRPPISALGLHPYHWLPLPSPSVVGSLVSGPLTLQSPSCIPSFCPRSRAIMYSRYGFFFCHMASLSQSFLCCLDLFDTIRTEVKLPYPCCTFFTQVFITRLYI